MKIVRVLIVLVLASCAIGGAWYLNRLGGDDAAYYGYVEGEYINLSAPASGVLDSLMVRRGTRVKAGAPLFTIDTTTASAERARAVAAKARAEANLADLTKGARPEEIRVQSEQLAEAAAALKNAEIELKRQESLKGTEVFIQAKYDTALAARDQAAARVKALSATIKVSHLPARDDRIDAASRAVAEADAAIKTADRRLAELQPAAPVDAMVQDTYYLPGAWVPGNMAVVTLLPDDKRKLRFFVPQSQIAKLQMGQEVSFSCDGCKAGLKATVSYIAPEAEYTPPVIYSAESREKLVFLVEAQINGGALLPVGLPIEIEK
ncbi:HlyD family secretion protein [Kordiimonas marina]|uniref:HlyD family secretion protein n=1 Tax=Kordiimonas marina TaxID=2872312 RepID=UPI001FF354B5|nr:HlyD family efflux transporter periplasmic adaptor subunit [Kordiimonas marina]MCJ9429425.1 HlyD family efflux transporter periplasmic adaptor subunit [Kordiimonas marina]